MKKLILLTFPLLIFCIFLSIVHVVVSNMLSTSGVELDSLQLDLVKYKKENILLREEVLKNTSLTNIASSAARMGFIDAKSVINLAGSETLTRR